MTAQTQKMYLRSENVVEKIVRHKSFWLVFILFGFSFPIYKSIYRTLPAELPIVAHLPDYEFISENGQRFGSKDLKDRVYLATFLSSRCAGECPKMWSDLEKIQKRIRGTGHKVAIVTFTVDPKFDNERVLFDFARIHKANPFHWSFLTDFDESKLAKLLQDGFKVMPNTPSNKIVLVDTENRIRGNYSFTDNEINKLMIDVGLLINRPSTKE